MPEPDRFPERQSRDDAYGLAHGTWPFRSVRFSRVELAGTSAAADVARSVVESHLGPLLDDGQLGEVRRMVSELVANALVHGDGRNGMVMHLAASPERIRVELCDGGSGFEVPREGLGLRLVDAWASRWGVAGDEGTSVWFELDRSPEARHSA